MHCGFLSSAEAYSRAASAATLVASACKMDGGILQLLCPALPSSPKQSGISAAGNGQGHGASLEPSGTCDAAPVSSDYVTSRYLARHACGSPIPSLSQARTNQPASSQPLSAHPPWSPPPAVAPTKRPKQPASSTINSILGRGRRATKQQALAAFLHICIGLGRSPFVQQQASAAAAAAASFPAGPHLTLPHLSSPQTQLTSLHAV
ncbi:hypothetical protein FALBO_6514 [Fusarium albosuccineum]|uniref:Uncharacterized protein n=1 Tax=Fusarium albosuccineum TaxID=1237068 RepID=A0A8H4PBQ3_9HYPO|nr:hypothetical protein FALBO_6514 [Fusarium albosuccineum]